MICFHRTFEKKRFALCYQTANSVNISKSFSYRVSIWLYNHIYILYIYIYSFILHYHRTLLLKQYRVCIFVCCSLWFTQKLRDLVYTKEERFNRNRTNALTYPRLKYSLTYKQAFDLFKCFNDKNVFCDSKQLFFKYLWNSNFLIVDKYKPQHWNALR